MLQTDVDKVDYLITLVSLSGAAEILPFRTRMRGADIIDSILLQCTAVASRSKCRNHLWTQQHRTYQVHAYYREESQREG